MVWVFCCCDNANMTVRFRAAIFLTWCLSACGGGGSLAPKNVAPPVIDTDVVLDVDLKDYVQFDLTYIARDSEGYQPPNDNELGVFDNLVLALLNNDLATSRALAGSLDLELVQVMDSGGAGGSDLYCVRESLIRGRGFFCIDYAANSSLHLSVPHSLFDSNTNHQSIAVLRGTGARYLSVSTTHRCANASASSCSGTTSVCGASGPYRVSDMAHNVDTFFQRFSNLVFEEDNNSINVQLHGCGASSCPANMNAGDIVARLSVGTTTDLADGEPVNRMRTSMQVTVDGLINGASVKSCSQAGETDRKLCGTTNTQGRYINGETSDPCGTTATNFGNSRFLHVEQNSDLRRDDGAGDVITPAILIDAINAELSL